MLYIELTFLSWPQCSDMGKNVAYLFVHNTQQTCTCICMMHAQWLQCNAMFWLSWSLRGIVLWFCRLVGGLHPSACHQWLHLCCGYYCYHWSIQGDRVIGVGFKIRWSIQVENDAPTLYADLVTLLLVGCSFGKCLPWVWGEKRNLRALLYS